MITLLLLIYSAVIHWIEAVIEAEHGDKRHWPSLVITFLFYAIPANCYGLPYKYLLLYPAVRVWFDYIFNYYRGNKIFYLGDTATWDKVLNKYNPYLILLGRIILSLTCIILTL